MKRLTITVLSFLCINCFGQEFSRKWTNLNYADDTIEYHMLDIFVPIDKKPAYSVVLLIYGNAWFGNNLKGSDLNTIGKALLENGFAVVAPNHRSSVDAKFPAQIHDIKVAIRFVRANAEQYQFDTSFVGLRVALQVATSLH